MVPFGSCAAVIYRYFARDEHKPRPCSHSERTSKSRLLEASAL
jgi:hypothetical protein